jgi:hypothetical protein
MDGFLAKSGEPNCHRVDTSVRAQSDRIHPPVERENNMEHAAALLVQTIVNSDERIQALLKDQAGAGPQAAAEFLKPWYQAMLMMIKAAEDFDQQ